jgi:SAM-dependent methyltransferase
MIIGRLKHEILNLFKTRKKINFNDPIYRDKPGLLELHKSLNEIFHEYSKQIGSIERGNFYQGLKSICIKGQRPTEKRFEIYGLRRFLKKNFSVLDIGSNCGFFSLYVSKFVGHVDGIEMDPYMVEIGNKVKNYLQIKNCTFYRSIFEKFKAGEKYDFIMSFAVHRRVNYPLEKYISILHKMLNKDGLLIIESQDIKVVDKYFSDEMKQIIKGKYSLLKEGTLNDDGINDRIFMILKKR